MPAFQKNSHSIYCFFPLIAGTPALTTRGLREKDIEKVVEYIDKALEIAKEAGAKSGPKLADFKKLLVDDCEIAEKIAKLREEVEKFSEEFPMPGYCDY